MASMTTPTTLSAASVLHEAGKSFHNEWAEHALTPKYTGTKFIAFRINGRRYKLRQRTAKCLVQACRITTGYSPASQERPPSSNHAPISSCYKCFSQCPPSVWRIESRRATALWTNVQSTYASGNPGYRRPTLNARSSIDGGIPSVQPRGARLPRR
jgi:hypothetical protein